MGNEVSTVDHSSSSVHEVGASADSSVSDFLTPTVSSSANIFVAPAVIVIEPPPSDVTGASNVIASGQSGYVAFAHASNEDDVDEVGVDAATQRIAKRNQVLRATILENAESHPKILLATPLRPKHQVSRSSVLSPFREYDTTRSGLPPKSQSLTDAAVNIQRVRQTLRRARELDANAGDDSANDDQRLPALPSGTGDARDSGAFGYMLRSAGASLSPDDLQTMLKYMRNQEQMKAAFKQGPLASLFKSSGSANESAPVVPKSPMPGTPTKSTPLSSHDEVDFETLLSPKFLRAHVSVSSPTALNAADFDEMTFDNVEADERVSVDLQVNTSLLDISVTDERLETELQSVMGRVHHLLCSQLQTPPSTPPRGQAC